MNKKILAISLCFVIVCGICVGCGKNKPDPIDIIVTDENGVAVTDENGDIVTKKGIPVTDKDGNVVTEKATNAKGEVVTDSNGDPKTIVVTEPEEVTTQAASEGKTTAASGDKTTAASTTKNGETTKANTTQTTKEYVEDSGKVPYSTTTPENNKTLDEWTFGNASKVGCIAPNGWTNETVNQVVKNGTDTRVQMCPVNYLEATGYKNADDYAKFIQDVSHGEGSGSKLISFNKDVYEDGTGIAILYKEKSESEDAEGHLYGKYHMIYLFQTGNRVRTYFVYATSEKEARTNIGPIIANTYYRG